MILKTVKDLIDEYKRRTSESTAHCEDCNMNIRRHAHFKIMTCHKVWFVPGTDFKVLPAGWSKATCACGKEFPSIEYEEIEVDPPCDCEGCKK
jgi:hypothetical protein